MILPDAVINLGGALVVALISALVTWRVHSDNKSDNKRQLEKRDEEIKKLQEGKLAHEKELHDKQLSAQAKHATRERFFRAKDFMRPSSKNDDHNHNMRVVELFAKEALGENEKSSSEDLIAILRIGIPASCWTSAIKPVHTLHEAALYSNAIKVIKQLHDSDEKRRVRKNSDLKDHAHLPES